MWIKIEDFIYDKYNNIVGVVINIDDERGFLLDLGGGETEWFTKSQLRKLNWFNYEQVYDEKGTGAIKPDHYKIGGLTAYKVIQAISSIYPAGLGFYVGNIIKYVFRAPRKNGVEDLKKAREYLDQLIEGYEEESK